MEWVVFVAIGGAFATIGGLVWWALYMPIDDDDEHDEGGF